jgi:hypothetical protein
VAEHEVAGNAERSGHVIMLPISFRAQSNTASAAFPHRFIEWKGTGSVAVSLLQALRQRDSILDCKGGALREIGQHGMSGVAEKRDPRSRP